MEHGQPPFMEGAAQQSSGPATDPHHNDDVGIVSKAAPLAKAAPPRIGANGSDVGGASQVTISLQQQHLPSEATPPLSTCPSNLSLMTNASCSSLASSAARPQLSASKPKLSSPAMSSNSARLMPSRPSSVLQPVGGAPPVLLRPSLSATVMADDFNSSSASTSFTRPHLPRVMTPTLPIGATSPPLSMYCLTTPMSSTHSSSRPSFRHSTALSPISAPVHVSSAVSPHTINGRLQPTAPSPRSGPSPIRPVEHSSRPTIFHRNTPVITEVEPAAPQLNHSAGSNRIPGTVQPLPREMKSFVLGQYRTLQQEVKQQPIRPGGRERGSVSEQEAERKAAGIQPIDLSSFQHIPKDSCPIHSQQGREARRRLDEAERLRLLQQQHHDMEIIRNGGREKVAKNMKSSTALAGSFSKLRARSGPNLRRNRSGSDHELIHSFSTMPSLADSQTVLHSTLEQASILSVNLEKSEEPRQSPTPQEEAWRTSQHFMAAVVESDSTTAGLKTRSTNKNGMKGEAIVVSMMSDSDDDDEKSPIGQLSSNQQADEHGWSLLPSTTHQDHLFASPVAKDVTPAKQAGERLSKQSPRHRYRPLLDQQEDSSDEESCYSFHGTRNNLMRSTTSLSSQTVGIGEHSIPEVSSTQLNLQIHQRDGSSTWSSNGSKMKSDSLCPPDCKDRHASEECCHCCPCRRPENFFLLCRSSSRDSSVASSRGEEEHTAHRTDEQSTATTHNSCGTEAPLPMKNRDIQGSGVSDGQQMVARGGPTMKSVSSRESILQCEDLEASDEEPMLSMQSFRRASIRRIT